MIYIWIVVVLPGRALSQSCMRNNKLYHSHTSSLNGIRSIIYIVLVDVWCDHEIKSDSIVVSILWSIFWITEFFAGFSSILAQYGNWNTHSDGIKLNHISIHIFFLSADSHGKFLAMLPVFISFLDMKHIFGVRRLYAAINVCTRLWFMKCDKIP